MWRDAAGDEIEAFVLEGQGFSFGVGRAHVVEATFGGFRLDHVEHFLGDVGCPDARNMRREGIGDVTAAGRNVEDAPVLFRRGQFDKALQALALCVRFAG